jgi:hypothetical protein
MSTCAAKALYRMYKTRICVSTVMALRESECDKKSKSLHNRQSSSICRTLGECRSIYIYVARCTSVIFEVFTRATMKNGVFWDVTPCGSCKNRRFGGTLRLLHQGESVN